MHVVVPVALQHLDTRAIWKSFLGFNWLLPEIVSNMWLHFLAWKPRNLQVLVQNYQTAIAKYVYIWKGGDSPDGELNDPTSHVCLQAQSFCFLDSAGWFPANMVISSVLPCRGQVLLFWTVWIITQLTFMWLNGDFDQPCYKHLSWCLDVKENS